MIEPMPDWIDHVPAVLVVPVTDAVNVCVVLTPTVAEDGEIVTATAETVIVAVAVCAGLLTPVAVIVAVWAVACP